MVREYIYSPHYDFFIDKTHREGAYEMHSFHLHKKYELYYLYEGTRRYFIDDSSYFVDAGSLVLIRPDEVHKTGSIDEKMHTRTVINFNEDFLTTMFSDAASTSHLLDCFQTGVHVVTVPMNKRGLTESILQRLWEIREENAEHTAILRRVLLSELLLYTDEFISQQSAAALDATRLTNDTIDAIQRYISVNYREKLSLADISAQFYISSSYLSRLFKRVTTLSIVEYINSVRIMAAKNLLEQTTLKVPEVASQAGFSTTVHFNRVFKEGTGLSPQQYRKFNQSSTVRK